VTEDRIRELARDLEPVKPIPRLRTVGIGLLVSWGVALVVDVWVGGPMPRSPGDPVFTTPSYLAALAGAVLVAYGATSAALASTVPGRAAAVRLGLRLTLAGVLLAFAGWAFGVTREPVDHYGDELGTIFACGVRSIAIGLVPALLCTAFALHAVLRGALATAALVLAGGAGLGAVAVQMSCASTAPLHQLLAHSLSPLFAVVVLTAPLALLMARFARRG